MKKIFLFDWGDTIMKNFPNEIGGMHTWHRVEAMPNAEKMLRKLSQQTDCYLATNAKDSDKEEIIKALQRDNLHKYFKDIFCYREIGYSKPSKEYFDSILDKLKVKKENLIMVGDNLETDINGAQRFGIDTILYASKDYYPEYHGMRIDNLLELNILFNI
ncbi:MAG: HAD-IA family hydrolase [Candidatus Cloacimonetes bacterium]|nr:HAD-IA family hydrolase [Candidatus Cloacimonadota bacterium]